MIFTCITIAILGAINIVGVKESTGVNVLLAVVDFLTQVLLVLLGAVGLVTSPPPMFISASSARSKLRSELVREF